MGGPLSRLLADLIIENKIEKQIMQHPRWKKCWDWVRLIDDTLSGWESEEIFDKFFEFLNTLRPGIKWTCEKEKEGRLPIFDIQLIRQNNEIMTTVYRKSSASDRYIHYTLWQPWEEKAGAIRTLKNRAHTYCSDEYLLVAFHQFKTGHEFDFDNTEIIARETNYWRRPTPEGIAIKAHDNLVNLQAGYMIDECWTPYLARQGGANQTISEVSG